MGLSRLVPIALILMGGACGRVGFDMEAGSAGDGGVNAAGRACATDLDCGPCERCGLDQVCAIEPINQVFAGHQVTCFLGASGSRWCVGNGDGIPGTSLFPTRIPGEDGWTSLTLGYGDGGSLGARNGEITSWRNDEAPVSVAPDPGWAQIANEDGGVCYRGATGELTCDGSPVAGTWTWIDEGFSKRCGVQAGAVYCWGTDDSNALGQGVEPNNTVVASPAKVGSATDWVEVATGAGLSCARKLDGTIWCWGGIDYTGTGSVDTLGQPVQVSPDTDWLWVQVHWYHACAGKPGGRVFCWGSGDGHDVVPGYPKASTPMELPHPWDGFVMGGHHYCGRTGGAWYCWGYNNAGQLGVGDNLTRNAPSDPLCLRQ